VSVTIPLMSPAFVACPKAAPHGPARRTPISKVDRPNFIPASGKWLPLYIVLVAVYRILSDSTKKTNGCLS
jgi:hypothetical protein